MDQPTQNKAFNLCCDSHPILLPPTSPPLAYTAGEGMRAAKNRLFTAMTEVPWLPGEGIPNDIDPLGDYQRALALGEPGGGGGGLTLEGGEGMGGGGGAGVGGEY
jgi:hypothetical protein